MAQTEEERKEHQRQYMRAYRAAKRGSGEYAETLRKNREYWKTVRTPEDKREQQLRTRYGITQKDYEQLLKKQKGGCAICKAKTGWQNSEKRLHVDHCHTTKNIRGLLCSGCNSLVGRILKIGKTPTGVAKLLLFIQTYLSSEGMKPTYVKNQYYRTADWRKQ